MNRQAPGSPASGDSSDADAGDASPATIELVNRIVRGDREALAELFSIYRPRLWRMVNFRLHPRVHGRVDADDVLQDAWLIAGERVSHFPRDAAPCSFILFRM